MPSIFISGGAAGIGLATAHRFAREGWTVGVYDLDRTALEAARAENTEFIVGTLDVRDEKQWEQALADFTSYTDGKLDVLDNNAGILVGGALQDISPAAVKRQIDIDVLGVTLGAQAAFPYLRDTAGSHLVNIASASAIYGQPDIATYSASKFYVAGLTEALELEWEPYDIRVVGIWPLWARTALAETDAKSIKTLGVHITPEQVADRIWTSVHPDAADKLLHRTRYSVGLQTTLLNNASRFVPSFVSRQVNKLIAQ